MIAIEIESKNKIPALESLASYKNEHIKHLYIRSDKTVTTQFTRLLKDIGSIEELTVWSPMTRTALRDCLSIKGLEVLNLFELTTPGKMIDTSKAVSLKEVNIAMPSASEVDLRIFSKLPKLTEISAHGAKWTVKLLGRFISKPLTRLGVEDSYMSYEMVSLIATSNSITSLDIGNSGLTGRGLAKIAKMKQLESLDIWNTKINADDLDLLTKLQHLNYLSIGGYLGYKNLDMEKVVSIILKIPNLTSLWVGGVALTDEQLSRLKQYIKTVRYDEDDYDYD